LGAQEALVANELVTALEEETAKEALAILLEPNGPNTFDAVIYDAVSEFSAQDEVPNKEPVNLPLKLPVKLPVLYEEVNALKDDVVSKLPVFTLPPPPIDVVCPSLLVSVACPEELTPRISFPTFDDAGNNACLSNSM
jgi:hypothetical protein